MLPAPARSPATPNVTPVYVPLLAAPAVLTAVGARRLVQPPVAGRRVAGDHLLVARRRHRREARINRRVRRQADDTGAGAGAAATRPTRERRTHARRGGEGHARAAREVGVTGRAAVDPGRSGRHGAGSGAALGDAQLRRRHRREARINRRVRRQADDTGAGAGAAATRPTRERRTRARRGGRGSRSCRREVGVTGRAAVDPGRSGRDGAGSGAALGDAQLRRRHRREARINRRVRRQADDTGAGAGAAATRPTRERRTRARRGGQGHARPVVERRHCTSRRS